MNELKENLEYQFFFSSYKSIKTLVSSEDKKIEQIFYEPRQAVCILKIYYGRDLTSVYQRLKEIRHENLAAIYDAIIYDGNTYIVEEAIDGETLEEYLKNEGIVSEEQVIHIVQEVCDGLQILHEQKPPLIHRDIKPSNVMIKEDGSIKIIDFDTVRFHKDNEECDTILLGTKEYASPEHYGYGQTDITSDIYSIGVMMNELLTGEMLSDHKATYKGRLLPVINCCIQVDFRKRYQSVKELRRIITSYQYPWGILLRNKRRITVCCIISMAILILSVSVMKNRNAWPDLLKAYEEETNPFLILENSKVDKKLKTLLGTEYSYVKECMHSIDSDVKYSDGEYFMQGWMPGGFSFMEAAMTLTNDENIECAFLENGICHYFSTDEEYYESPSSNMINWMSSFTNYEIQFKDHEENAVPEDISGIYRREDSNAFIVITEAVDDQYEIEGHASWEINTGDIEGELLAVNSQQYSYVEGTEEYKSELRILVYDDRLFVQTVEGVFGGLNVTFDGTYKKQ